jgi:hypothetical protein
MTIPLLTSLTTAGPLSISGTNVSEVWARAFLEVTRSGTTLASPLVVSVFNPDGEGICEDRDIRQVLDFTLLKSKGFSTETVASTIFPRSLWNPNSSRHQLYERYLRMLPQLIKAKRGNRHGLYFARLISSGPNNFNQLEHIIQTYKRGNHRRTALQASIFDPVLDHTHEVRRGFPCLQQVAFAPTQGRGLIVTGFYASQYIFERGYGNYLGLCNLGSFMAHELGLRLTQMNCIAAVAKSGDVPKAQLADLIDYLRNAAEGSKGEEIAGEGGQ